LDGLAIYAGLRGPERAQRMRRTVDSGDLGSTMIAMSMEFVFGRIWSRDVLDAKQRSLVTIGILIALRHTEALRTQIRIGLTSGLSVRQIEEATIQAAAYVGFPAAHTASNAILEVLQDPSFARPPVLAASLRTARFSRLTPSPNRQRLTHSSAGWLST